MPQAPPAIARSRQDYLAEMTIDRARCRLGIPAAPLRSLKGAPFHFTAKHLGAVDPKTYCPHRADVKPLSQVMSEFKFTCPVCGQHIAADSTAAGAQIECPTCYQPIIVPRPPRPDSKYILSATQYIRPPPPASPPEDAGVRFPAARGWWPRLLASAVVVSVLGAAVYLRLQPGQSHDAGIQSPDTEGGGDHGGGDRTWTLDLSGATYPGQEAAGKVHSRAFHCRQAIVQNGLLVLRQGSGYEPDLAVNVLLPHGDSARLAGKEFNVTTNHGGLAPRIVLRWTQDQLQVAQSFTNGYAMKLAFGQLAADKLHGRIYLCLPDRSKSFVAGSFAAEIRNPAPPKFQ
jgi:predicted RNA-binding Zn-ribbon protein involved in translation (DUF1610 family)